jgi:hypothetical protein
LKNFSSLIFVILNHFPSLSCSWESHVINENIFQCKKSFNCIHHPIDPDMVKKIQRQNNGHLDRQGRLVTAPERHLHPDLVATHRGIVDRQGQLQLLAVTHRARVERAGRAQGLLLN